MSEREQIVASLTDRQRQALRDARGGKIPWTTAARCRCALQDKGLVVKQIYSEKLTPLGLLVAADVRADKEPTP